MKTITLHQMTCLYKLTDQNLQTHGATQWELNVPLIATGDSTNLCSDGVIHAYRSLALGLLMNPAQAKIVDPRLFSCVGEVVVEDATKVGCKTVMLTSEIELPVWYRDEPQRLRVQVEFAIACAEAVLPIYEKVYPQDMRARNAIAAAAADAKTAPAADAAYDPAAYAASARAAARAARAAAANAARAAANAADAADAARANTAAAATYADIANAAYAASTATYAARAAAYAASARASLSLVELADAVAAMVVK